MRLVHLIAVVANDESEAIENALVAIKPYEDDVWNQCEVGGKWAGMLNGKNALCAQDDLEAFKRHVEDALKFRDAAFRALRNKIVGKEVAENEVPDSEDDRDKKEAAKRITKQNKREMCRFLNAMQLNSLPKECYSEAELAGYHVYALGRLMAGYYSFDSRFFDGANCSVFPQYLFERLEKDLEHQWIVAIDLNN